MEEGQRGDMRIHSATSAVERRAVADRRAQPTSCWSALRSRGRRRGFRRASEGHNGYVDCPTPYVAALVLWVTLSSACDALLTLLHISNGGGEANPVMALALAYGSTTFVGLKMSMTCLGTWALSILQHVPLASIVLHILMLIYLGIMGMHAVILLS